MPKPLLLDRISGSATMAFWPALPSRVCGARRFHDKRHDLLHPPWFPSHSGGSPTSKTKPRCWIQQCTVRWSRRVSPHARSHLSSSLRSSLIKLLAYILVLSFNFWFCILFSTWVCTWCRIRLGNIEVSWMVKWVCDLYRYWFFYPIFIFLMKSCFLFCPPYFSTNILPQFLCWF